MNLLLRIARQGKSIFAMLSDDNGMSWTEPHESLLENLPDTVYVGVASTNGRTADLSVATFCDISFGARFRRGDCDDDGAVNVSDAVCALNWIFGGGEQPGCVAALNTNGDAKVDLADALWLLNFLFGTGPIITDPFPDCGPSILPADAELGCFTGCQ